MVSFRNIKKLLTEEEADYIVYAWSAEQSVSAIAQFLDVPSEKVSEYILAYAKNDMDSQTKIHLQAIKDEINARERALDS